MLDQYIRARRNGPASLLPTRTSDLRVDGYSKTAKPLRGPSTLVLVAASAFCLAFLAIALWLSKPIIKAYRTSRTPDFASEMVFVDETGGERPFPSLLAPDASVDLVTVSVVVPAYNEEERMAGAMDEMIGHLKDSAAGDPTFTWEVLLVDDGSKDATAAMAQALTDREGGNRVRLLRLHANSGKGAAVRKGVMRARGRYILMADADGATAASDLATLMARIRPLEQEEGQEVDAATGTGSRAVAIGSRAHMNEGDAGAVKRSPVRRFLMWGFHTFLGLIVGGSGGGIRDTQCGFKLFTRAAARDLFSVLHIERWAFDVELVYLAARRGIPMAEVPVHWHEVGGSKVDLVSASLQMLRDIIVIRTCYATGIWADEPPTATATVTQPLDGVPPPQSPPAAPPPRFVDGALGGDEEEGEGEVAGGRHAAPPAAPAALQQKRPLHRRAPLQKRKGPARAAGSRNVPQMMAQQPPTAGSGGSGSAGQRGPPPAHIVAARHDEAAAEDEDEVVGGPQQVPVEHPPPIIDDEGEDGSGRDMR